MWGCTHPLELTSRDPFQIHRAAVSDAPSVGSQCCSLPSFPIHLLLRWEPDVDFVLLYTGSVWIFPASDQSKKFFWSPRRDSNTEELRICITSFWIMRYHGPLKIRVRFYGFNIKCPPQAKGLSSGPHRTILFSEVLEICKNGAGVTDICHWDRSLSTYSLLIHSFVLFSDSYPQ